eukprot:8033966-Alexandrium_andersonii.AAC.1
MNAGAASEDGGRGNLHTDNESRQNPSTSLSPLLRTSAKWRSSNPEETKLPPRRRFLPTVTGRNPFLSEADIRGATASAYSL